ncbi:hypothetical protein [Thermococcus sp.]
MKHKVTLSDEEIKLIIEALESADFYFGDTEFYKQLEKLRNRLERLLDYDYVEKRRLAGRIGASNYRLKLKYGI